MTGLTNEQVQERIAEGKVNVNENPNNQDVQADYFGEYTYVFQLSEPCTSGAGPFCEIL